MLDKLPHQVSGLRPCPSIKLHAATIDSDLSGRQPGSFKVFLIRVFVQNSGIPLFDLHK
tara:strand:- start:507 stop:683 length:177 start_codon:yes stop_codon:yes gene_type:complete